MKTNDCIFCLETSEPRGQLLHKDDLWFAVSSIDPTLKAGALIITRRHIQTPFEISSEEWSRLHEIIPKVKEFLDDTFQPDGYNMGWNITPVAGQQVAHAHLHLFGRYKHEPLAGKGIRSAFREAAQK
ncbi:MAG TPA: HIT family protein [Candidatus Saccharimonadales bacterium]|nr:HIT family protein [Candidatus Saccharimonadales bacterium]